jgi:drug/metabolite transporter (DMT)-like permease
MLWGSYAPSLRLAYTSAEPPDAVVVMAVRGVIQAAILLAASAISNRQPGQESPNSSSGAGGAAVDSKEGKLGLWEQWLTLRSPPLWMAALELGLWNYLGTATQTVGLQLTGATRASFLVQLSVLLTPLLATLAGDRPSGRVWAGCAMALGGTLLIAADKAAGGGGAGVAQAAGLHLGE